MAEQLLECVDIVRVLQQVGGESMPKCVAERANETVGYSMAPFFAPLPEEPPN